MILITADTHLMPDIHAAEARNLDRLIFGDGRRPLSGASDLDIAQRQNRQPAEREQM